MDTRALDAQHLPLQQTLSVPVLSCTPQAPRPGPRAPEKEKQKLKQRTGSGVQKVQDGNRINFDLQGMALALLLSCHSAPPVVLCNTRGYIYRVCCDGGEAHPGKGDKWREGKERSEGSQEGKRKRGRGLGEEARREGGSLSVAQRVGL